MNAETKTKLEEFYKQRIKFNIRSIDVNQANPNINIYDFTTNIFFKTRVTFTGDKFLMSEFYKHLKPISSMIMRRLAQFVRLRASRVCVSRLRAFVSRASRVLSRVRLASACICLACVSRLSASVHVKGSECVRLRLSRVGRLVSHLSACICLASVSRLSACICLASVRLHLSRVGRLVSRLSRVGRLVSRLSVSL